MTKTFTTCDVCGSAENVINTILPMIRTTDCTEGRALHEPRVDFTKIDICKDYLLKATNINDHRVMGYGDITISPNENLKKSYEDK